MEVVKMAALYNTKTVPELVAEGLKKALEETKKNPDPEEAKRFLIAIGALDENGNEKSQICTGGYTWE